MEKSIFMLHIFLMHVLVFLNFLLKKVKPSFQYKSVIKKTKVDNYEQIKKMLGACII